MKHTQTHSYILQCVVKFIYDVRYTNATVYMVSYVEIYTLDYGFCLLIISQFPVSD